MNETRHPLGRLVRFDERSRDYPVRALLPGALGAERTRMWRLPSTAEVLNQGRDGACVGFGVTNELRYTPTPTPRLDNLFARDLYWAAQRLDPWDGGAYPGAQPQYEGTSVLSGVQAAQAAGWYGEYRWAFGEPDLAAAVGNLGPVIIGVPWLEGMFECDDAGYLRLTGKVVGGHCVLVVGISLSRDDYTISNSWGAGWPTDRRWARGRARITRADMARLLAENGEACIPTIRTRPKSVTA